MSFYCIVKRKLNKDRYKDLKEEKLKLKDLKERGLNLNGRIMCNNCTKDISDEDYVKIASENVFYHEECPY